MTLQKVFFMGVLGLSTLAPLATAPAQACTPAPDNPNGCDGLNGGTPRINPELYKARPVLKLKRPIGPVCLSCPPDSLKLKDRVVQPVLQEDRILLNKDRFAQPIEQPQSFGR